jgi:hypothetical protein
MFLAPKSPEGDLKTISDLLCLLCAISLCVFAFNGFHIKELRDKGSEIAAFLTGF